MSTAPSSGEAPLRSEHDVEPSRAADHDPARSGLTVIAGSEPQFGFRGKHRDLSGGQQAVNVAHARIRAVGEQAMAT